MNEHEFEALKYALGLSEIDDPQRVRAEIEKRLRDMNAMDRAAVEMKIGTRLQELEARAAGAAYSPATFTGGMSGVALRERIRAHLPIRTDRSIHLIAGD